MTRAFESTTAIGSVRLPILPVLYVSNNNFLRSGNLTCAARMPVHVCVIFDPFVDIIIGRDV